MVCRELADDVAELLPFFLLITALTRRLILLIEGGFVEECVDFEWLEEADGSLVLKPGAEFCSVDIEEVPLIRPARCIEALVCRGVKLWRLVLVLGNLGAFTPLADTLCLDAKLVRLAGRTPLFFFRLPVLLVALTILACVTLLLVRLAALVARLLLRRVSDILRSASVTPDMERVLSPSVTVEVRVREPVAAALVAILLELSLERDRLDIFLSKVCCSTNLGAGSRLERAALRDPSRGSLLFPLVPAAGLDECFEVAREPASAAGRAALTGDVGKCVLPGLWRPR